MWVSEEQGPCGIQALMRHLSHVQSALLQVLNLLKWQFCTCYDAGPPPVSLCSYEVAGRREQVVPRAAWGLVGGVRGPDVRTTAAPQVGLAGLCSSSRTGRHTRGGGTLASWWHQSRPACRTRPQAEGLSWGGPSHPSCWEEVAASPPGKAVFLVWPPHLYLIH